MTLEPTTEMPAVPPAIHLAENLPRAFGRYTLLHHLARGGMGDVYLAVSGGLRGLERVCVVKTVRSELSAQKVFVDRFLDEGQVLTRLSHGNIAQVHEVGLHDGSYFVALEYVEGKDLAKILERLAERQRPLPLSVALHVTCAVLDALQYAHACADRDGRPLGLIHRDVSPQNVLISYGGDVKLIDFGNARTEIRRHETAAGLIFGKPGYIAPEQARGEKPDPRSDVYAVGVTLWECLAGKRLMDEGLEKFLPRLRAGLVEPPALQPLRDDVTPEVEEVIARAMAPNREHRFSDAGSMRAELGPILSRLGPTKATDLMTTLFAADIAVERRLIAQLIERAPAEMTAVVEVPPTAPSPEPRQGAGIRYRILERLGEGAMGEVFAAEHTDLEKVVALKILHREHSQNREFVERFRREARAVARIGHPNIVQVNDFGETADGRVFFAMEKLEGESLEGRLQREGALPQAEALRIAEEICQALVAAHGEGIVHRDLKPDNVFLTRDGLVKLLDFGIAKTMGLGEGEKLTRAGQIFGTPEYMAPEQAAGRPVDPRTDLYAVGVMLYEMVTGSLPFKADSAVGLLHSHIFDEPERPSRRAPARAIRRATEKAILTALAKEPEERFASAELMSAELHSARTVPERRSSRSRRWLLVGVAAAVLTLVSFAAVMFLDPAPRPRPIRPDRIAAEIVVPSSVPNTERTQARRTATTTGEQAVPPAAVPVWANPRTEETNRRPKPVGARSKVHELLIEAAQHKDAGRRQQALDAYLRAYRMTGRPNEHLLYIQMLRTAGQHTRARTELEIAGHRYPGHAGIQRMLNSFDE